jgi:hypothetical protein
MSDKVQKGATLAEELRDVENPDKVILSAVPENKKKEVEEALMVIRGEMYSGPIPPPEALARYEEIQPGAADRIIKMAEKQQEHRMSLETKAIGGQIDQSKRGQIFGFIAILLCIGVAVFFAVAFDMTTFAEIFLTVTMVILVTLFITGKNVMRKDLKEKSKDQEK